MASGTLNDLTTHLGRHYDPPPGPFGDSDDQTAKAGLVHDLFYRAQAARRPLIGQWKRNYRTLNNRQWAPRSEPWIPAPEIAKIWPVCASIVSWITDQRPTLTTTATATPFTPFADQYAQLANDMNTQLQLCFNEYMLDAEIAKILWDVLTYRIGYFKTTWEPWLADGLGDSVFRRTDPFTIYPDPFARSESQLNYIIEAKVMSVQDLIRAYPDAAGRLPIGMLNIDSAPHVLEGTLSETGPRLNLAPISPATAPHSGLNTQGRGSGYTNSDSPVVVVLEAWIRGLKEVDGKTYDCWKCVVACGRSIIMEADASEIYGHNRHPYDRLVLFDTGEWYGPGLVEMLASPQESINRTLQAIEANLQLMGDPMLVESPMSQSRRHRITNRPGQRIDADPSMVSWLQPPQMQPQIAVQLMQYYESQVEAISGMSAMVRGFQPSGRNAQGVLDSVQDAAFVRIRGTLRELERALKGVCTKMTANIAEFYTEPRVSAILGPDGAPSLQQLRAQHFYIIDPASPDPGDKIPLRFNVAADAGSQLLTSKQARAALAIQLFTLGAIDEPALLEMVEFPNWGVLAKRVQEAKAQQGTLGQPPGARQRSQRTA